MIAVIDYGAGNILSVQNSLKRVNAEYIITDRLDEIKRANKIILPGVGDASYAMSQLRERGLVDIIKDCTTPLLGICVGMQLLCQYTEEGNSECLGIVPNRIRKLVYDGENKVPNVGWCEVKSLKTDLFKGINEGDFLYYVHSFAADVNKYTICQSEHSEPFSGAIGLRNFYGCQFHPEKSGAIGEKIIKNFLQL